MSYIEIKGSGSLTLPPDIDQLLATGLRDFRQPQGMTDLYNVEGHPSLLVRIYEDRTFLDTTHQGLEAAYVATQYDVNVLPSRLYVADRVCHVVTTKVVGRPLDELLGNGPSRELIDQTDTLYAGLGRYVMDAMVNHGFASDDIYDPGQYMYGATLQDPTPKIWLVDLPDGARSFAPHRRRDQHYNITVLDWINGIVTVEGATKATLQTARSIAEPAFELSSQTYHGNGWVAAFQNALAEGIELDTDEPPIAELCTF